MGEALGLAVFFLMIACFATAFSILVFDVNPIARWQEHRRTASERHLPLYERLARAEEREAEKNLERGHVDLARSQFRSAQRLRSQAIENMKRGEEPLI